MRQRDGEKTPTKLLLGVASGSRCARLCSLHAGSVWNGGVRLAQLIERGCLRDRLRGKTVLELGAGAALPSLVLLAQPQEFLPAAVIISDYDDTAIVEAMQDNLQTNRHAVALDLCRVVGHVWGTSTAPLTNALCDVLGGSCISGFDVVLLAEIMWDPSLHASLIATLAAVLAVDGEVWMCHCHHWEGHEKADAHFFALARDRGIGVERLEAEDREMACLFSGEYQRACVFRLRWVAATAAERLAQPPHLPTAAAASGAEAGDAPSEPEVQVAAGAGAVEAAVLLPALPDDVLEHVCDAVCLSEGRRAPHSVAALRGSCQRLREVCGGASLLDRLSAPLGAASGAVSSLEQLAVLRAVHSLVERGGALVGFEFAGAGLDDEAGTDSGVVGTRAILGAWARVLRRHPRLRVRIDAHCGPTAPRALARVYSRKRGLRVAAELAAGGVSMGRIEIAGWGKALARRAARSRHPCCEPARMGCGWAEVYVLWPAEGSREAMEMPTRADVYQHARVAATGGSGARAMPRAQPADEMSDGSEASETDGAAEEDDEDDEDDEAEDERGPGAADAFSLGSLSDGEEHADRVVDLADHLSAAAQQQAEAVQNEEDETQLRRGLLASDEDEDSEA